MVAADRSLSVAVRIGWGCSVAQSAAVVLEHAVVPQPAHHDELFDADVGQEEVERGGVEGRVLRLEHEIVLLSRQQLLDDRPPGLFAAIADQAVEVRAPAAEVVVGVDRDVAGVGGPPQPGDLVGHRESLRQEPLGAGEVEGVDDIDQQHGGPRVIRDVAVEHGVTTRAERHVTSCIGNSLSSRSDASGAPGRPLSSRTTWTQRKQLNRETRLVVTTLHGWGAVAVQIQPFQKIAAKLDLARKPQWFIA